MIQNRENGVQDFYQNFEAYIEGFGKLDGEFWMGLLLKNKKSLHNTITVKFILKVCSFCTSSQELEISSLGSI